MNEWRNEPTSSNERVFSDRKGTNGSDEDCKKDRKCLFREWAAIHEWIEGRRDLVIKLLPNWWRDGEEEENRLQYFCVAPKSFSFFWSNYRSPNFVWQQRGDRVDSGQNEMKERPLVEPFDGIKWTKWRMMATEERIAGSSRKRSESRKEDQEVKES